MSHTRLLLTTAIAPILWGTTYIITTEVLPPDRPLLAATLRALPAGLLLLGALAIRQHRAVAPGGAWWWRASALGAVNIAIFFALLFVAAYRLPGGIAAVLGAIGPFMVAAMAVPLLGERPTSRLLAAGALGVAGVALLVLRSSVSLDPIGLLAAAASTASVSLGTVLVRRWGLPPGYADRGTALLAVTGWQLTAGGLLLAPLALAAEGLPASMDVSNVLGYTYLSVISSALAYLLFLPGAIALSSVRVSMLSLLSPVVAAAIGWIVLGQSLTIVQLCGGVVVIGAVVLASAPPAKAEQHERQVPRQRTRRIRPTAGVPREYETVGGKPE